MPTLEILSIISLRLTLVWWMTFFLYSHETLPLKVVFIEYYRLSTGALSRLILSDDSLRMAVNELRTSKVELLKLFLSSLLNNNSGIMNFMVVFQDSLFCLNISNRSTLVIPELCCLCKFGRHDVCHRCTAPPMKFEGRKDYDPFLIYSTLLLTRSKWLTRN